MSKKRGRTLTLGVIIGFFIGLFLAPKKGTELRQDAKKKIDSLEKVTAEIKEKKKVLPDNYAAQLEKLGYGQYTDQ